MNLFVCALRTPRDEPHEPSNEPPKGARDGTFRSWVVRAGYEGAASKQQPGPWAGRSRRPRRSWGTWNAPDVHDWARGEASVATKLLNSKCNSSSLFYITIVRLKITLLSVCTRRINIYNNSIITKGEPVIHTDIKAFCFIDRFRSIYLLF